MQLNRVTSAADRVPIRNALISVADKTGLEEFAEQLWTLIPDLTVYSTGGTFAFLEKVAARIATERGGSKPRLQTISVYTGQPEMQGGLVKTLDFRVYLSLLSEQFNRDHQADMKRTGAIPFDLTICSLYPFEQTALEQGVTLEDLRTHIDIGGPTMLRASAKNFLRVLPVCRSEDYQTVLAEIEAGEGTTSLEFRLSMALEAFRYTARYEASIAEHLQRVASSTTLEQLYSKTEEPLS